MASKNTDFRAFVPVTRIDEEERMVYGYATREDIIDSYGTIIDLESVKRCLPDYMKFPTIREMHEPSAVGRADDVTADKVGVYIGAKVVDDIAWKKVKEKVYRGFSIGGKKDYQVDNRVFLKSITEFSLVDRPSNEGCLVDEFRIDKPKEDVNMKFTCALEGHEHETEGDAKRCIEDVTLRYEKGEEIDSLKPEFLATITRKAPKKAEGGEVIDLKRYMGEEIYDVQAATSCLDTIMYLFSKETSETHPEAAGQIADLKTVIEKLKSFIASEIKEDNSPVSPVVAMAAGGEDDINRKGAAISKSNLERLQTMHDHCVDMGARCNRDDSVEAGAAAPDLTRLESMEGDIKRLEGEKADLVKRLADLETENQKLKDEPAPAKGVTRAVSKEQDNIDPEKQAAEEADLKRIDGLPADEAALELIKRSYRNPQIMRVI